MYNLEADLANRITEDLRIGNALASRRILLTGGTGFVGTWLLRALEILYESIDGSGSTTVLARSFRPWHYELASHNRRIRLLERDVRDLTTNELPNFDLVFHCATPSTSPREPQYELELSTTIIEGQQSLLRSLRPAAPRFVFISSGAVYGDSRGRQLPFAETDFVGGDPLVGSTYGESKRLAERRLCLAHDAEEIDLTVARLFAFSGPFLPWDAHFAVGNFIRDVARGKKILVESDGLSMRSYLHGSDLVAWIFMIAISGESRSAYNVGSDRYLNIGQLAHIVNDVLEGSGVEIIGLPRSAEAIDNYTPSVAKAKRELGAVESITLEESIRASYLWGLR